MGLTEALLLIIIIILLAQFMPEALFLGFMGLAIVGGIIVAGIAALLLWQALGPDNLGLIIGGAGLAFFAFVGLRELVRFYQLPLADPPIDPNTGQPLRSPRHVGKVATAVTATIFGLILAGDCSLSSQAFCHTSFGSSNLTPGFDPGVSVRISSCALGLTVEGTNFC